ncbi:hypothetical protein J3R30DRAFT_3511305 [Lentinula aciculospora]|uniref:LYC1 C-terminal domain-containing protein n=1 Tax=Lentinula aciculospora TaxID=153920 RepID=A0A9W9A3M4_9AGAR|nr:hypothetical protein J3R30DRAFT_3511305 [Lentinula aciculospora]
MDPSTLSIFPATPRQTEASRRATGSSDWGNGMTLDQYVQRDMDLEKSDCGRDGKYMTWVLAPRTNPSALDFLCSCEIFRRDGLSARTNPNTPSDPKPWIEQVECYGIASVFTPPSNRGKGYARLMMSLLHWILAGNKLPFNSFPSDVWGSKPVAPSEMGNATFSALWSDVGDFYEWCSPDCAVPTKKKNGWVVRGLRTTRWRPRKNVDSLMYTDSAFTGQWHWLTHEEVDQLCIHDAKRMPDDLRARWLDHSSAPPTEPKTLFTFLPSGGVEAFQRERLRHFWEKENIAHWGVVFIDPANECTSDLSMAQAFATWTLELRPSAPRTLVVTRLHCATHSEQPERVECRISGILQGIWEYSIKYDIEVIEIWNFPTDIKEVGYRRAERWFVPFGEEEEYERPEHLPAFKWYGHGSEAGADMDFENSSEIEWMFNERFCWC